MPHPQSWVGRDTVLPRIACGVKMRRSAVLAVLVLPSTLLDGLSSFSFQVPLETIDRIWSTWLLPVPGWQM